MKKIYLTSQWGEGIIHTFGYSERDLLFNWEIWVKCIHPDDNERVVKNLNYHIENHLRNWQDEYRFKAANGSYKDVFSRGYLLFYNDGKPSRMYGSTTDITERKKLEKELATQQVKQQKLITETTLLVQEKERNELGKELHDNINQILATVKMYLGLIKNNKNNLQELLEKSTEFVNEAIEEIRKLSKSLVSPSLGNSSLEQALADLVYDVDLASELKMELRYNIDPEIEIGDKKELMIYRIVQEQINNILRHSHAKNAFVDLRKVDDNLLLIISDDGIGFDKNFSKYDTIDNVIDFMSKKINQTISLEDIATTVNLSSSHFSNLFKKKTGFSPIEYFNHLKIQKSCQYLLFTDLRVKEISYNLGINDPYYFSRLFTKVMGISPNEYRKKKAF